jgi:hypothetical protein
LLLLVVALREIWRRRSDALGFWLLPLLAGAVLTLQFTPQLLDSARAVAANILLEQSPTVLVAGENEVENAKRYPILITALNDGSCPIDQSSASEPKCEEGTALSPGQSCNVNVACPKIVFATSGTYTGDLVTEAATLGLGDFTDDGLGAGDAICTKLGGDAGLPGSYTAWLSDSTTPAQDRVSHSNVPYVLTNGLQVAADYQDLTFEDATTCTGNGSADCLDHMIDRNESQGLVAQDQVWTSTQRDGTVNGVDFCDDWTSADGGLSGAVGITNGQNKNWTQQTGSYCNNSRRLYCFQD